MASKALSGTLGNREPTIYPVTLTNNREGILMKRNHSGVLFAFVMMMVPFFALTLLAQSKSTEKGMDKMPAGFQGAFLQQSMAVEKQFVSLAEAIPQDKYTWRPAEGVRSIAESFLHVAGGNYLLPQFIGMKPPGDIQPQAFEKSTTDKAKIIEAIKKSFQYINDVVMKTPDADLEKRAEFFGNKTIMLGVLLIAATHQHETLGQAIAYARSNQVTPPWTVERQERIKEQQGNKM